MLVGIISDTHIPNKSKSLPKKVFESFEKVDLILHAGDICHLEVIEELELIAPVKAVAGNMDGWDIRNKYPRKQIIDIKGFKIGLIHGDGMRGTTLQRVVAAFTDENLDCIVFGHSHQAYMQLNMNVLLFNPGSPTDRRRNKFFSCGLLTIGKRLESHILFF